MKLLSDTVILCKNNTVVYLWNLDMKKVLFILSFLLLAQFAYSRDEVPLLMDTSAINVGYEEDNNSLINVENMKKAKSVERAKNEMVTPQNSRIKLDSRQIYHQRALDWATKQTNSTMMPIF